MVDDKKHEKSCSDFQIDENRRFSMKKKRRTVALFSVLLLLFFYSVILCCSKHKRLIEDSKKKKGRKNRPIDLKFLANNVTAESAQNQRSKFVKIQRTVEIFVDLLNVKSQRFNVGRIVEKRKKRGQFFDENHSRTVAIDNLESLSKFIALVKTQNQRDNNFDEFFESPRIPQCFRKQVETFSRYGNFGSDGSTFVGLRRDRRFGRAGGDERRFIDAIIKLDDSSVFRSVNIFRDGKFEIHFSLVFVSFRSDWKRIFSFDSSFYLSSSTCLSFYDFDRKSTKEFFSIRKWPNDLFSLIKCEKRPFSLISSIDRDKSNKRRIR